MATTESAMPRDKSWRDIDSIRDKNSGQGKGRFRIHTPKTSRGYKSDLNKLFDKGEVPDRFKTVLGGVSDQSAQGAERQQLIRQARNATSTEDFNTACTALIARFDLPDDQKLMMRMLDHPDEPVIQKALEHLIEMDGRRPLHKRPLLTARLKIIEQIAQEGRTHELIEQLGERL